MNQVGLEQNYRRTILNILFIILRGKKFPAVEEHSRFVEIVFANIVFCIRCLATACSIRIKCKKIGCVKRTTL